MGPVVLGPVVLGPVVLGPVVLGPVVLGPVVLGPVVNGTICVKPKNQGESFTLGQTAGAFQLFVMSSFCFKGKTLLLFWA